MTTEIEARLKLSAIDRTKAAFASVRRGLAGITGQAAAVNRASAAMNRTALATDRVGMSMLAMGRVVAPAALALGGVAAVRRYASAERALTRIAITAGASDRAVAAAGKSMRTIAHDAALPLDSVREGLETLVAAGKSLDDAMAMLPAVARTAQASDSALSDIASSAAAIGDSFKISAGEMESAFDILAMGGKLGKFELPDMAQYLPSLAPQFATLGYEGEEGLTRLVALLQTVRIQTGEASTAAASLSDLVGKMEVDDTQKRFMKFGINVRRELAKARDEGEDLIDTFVNLAEKAVGGDLSQLPLLLGDKEARRALTALIQLRSETARFRAELGNAAGTVDADVERVVSNAEASIQRLSNATDSLVKSTGRLADTMGASSAFGDLASFLDALSDKIEKNSARRGGIVDWLGGGDDNNLVDWLNEQLDGVLNIIATEHGRVGKETGDGAPGAFYPSPLKAQIEAAKGDLADALLGALPPPLPLPAPARLAAGDAAGDGFALPRPRQAADAAAPPFAHWDPSYAMPRPRRGDGRPRDAAAGAGEHFVLPLPRADADAPAPPAKPWTPSYLTPRRRPGAGADNASDSAAGAPWSPVTTTPGDPVPLWALAAPPPTPGADGDGSRNRDLSLYGDGAFAPRFGGPPVGSFVADRPPPDLGGLPAAAAEVVTSFGDLAAEAARFKALLANEAPSSPSGRHINQMSDEELLAALNGGVVTVDPGHSRPPPGDATLGSAGGFRSDDAIGAAGGADGFRGVANIDAIGEAADDAADKLRQLPEAMNPGAFAAAGQAGATAFSTAFGRALTVGVRNAFAAAEAEARAGAARLGAIAGSVKVRPATVNADRGRSWPHLVNADRGPGEPELGGLGML